MWAPIAMLTGHFLAAATLGNTPYGQVISTIKKSKTGLYIIRTLLKKYAD